MRFPMSLNISLTKYMLKNKFQSRDIFPIVLMLEPTHVCNLSCEGCGRIREYKETLNIQMDLSECIKAIDESGTPVVSITGGEPLMYEYIGELVEYLVKKKRHIYLCTNGLLLRNSLHKFKPSQYLNFNISLDGLEERHDTISGRSGVFHEAVEAIKDAKRNGFRVCTNTSIFKETDMKEIEELFKLLTSLNTDGFLVAPAFSFEAIGNKDIFLIKKQIHEKFQIIYELSKKYTLLSTPLYINFLRGKRSMECTPWGNPTYNIKGWRSPCYLIADKHYGTFKELMENTDWEKYGNGKDDRCSNCMMHCGFEPTVVRVVGNNMGDLWEMIKWNMA